jgi:hypothetical protein
VTLVEYPIIGGKADTKQRVKITIHPAGRERSLVDMGNRAARIWVWKIRVRIPIVADNNKQKIKTIRWRSVKEWKRLRAQRRSFWPRASAEGGVGLAEREELTMEADRERVQAGGRMGGV